MDGSIPREVLGEMLDAAVKAPSPRNTQPWHFTIEQGSVELAVDRTRALPVNDPDGRELTVSCGTALFNLEVAARHFGYWTEVTLLPDPARPDVMVRIEFDDVGGPTDWDLYGAIEQRHTARGAFDPAAVSDDLVGRLSAVSALHDVSLRVVHESEREGLAQLVVQGDHWRFADPAWRREIAGWMHPRRHGDGLAVPELVARVTQAVIARHDRGDSAGRHDRVFVEDAPFIGVLATARDDVRSWLEVGRALEHLLLVAALDGVQAGFVNQPVQVPFLRDRLRRTLTDQQFPQLVFRMGHPAGHIRPSVRRSVDDVVGD